MPVKTIFSVLKSENVYVKQEEKAVAEVNAAVAEQTDKTEETVGANN